MATKHAGVLKKDDVLLLWGGEDISPSLYGETRGRWTGALNVPSIRDNIEVDLIRKAIELELPIIGVCRGAQLMCAMSGGKLVQHVEGHAIGKRHPIVTNYGRTLSVNSLHHQMMNPFKVDHELIAWTPKRLSCLYLDSTGPMVPPPEKEAEIVFFPKTKALCIQGHPEYLNRDDEFVSYSRELVEKYVLNKTEANGKHQILA
jgi:gamma-glutamyl-gamma-aminobutyrate hydrolase PuuD